MPYDVIVIGGGPSGLMASIAACEEGARVLLVDKGNHLGRKLGISGGGRCNVTNAMELDELIRHIPGNGRFLHSALAQFNNQDIIRFFENMGIRLKEEDRGRMFPVTDSAKTVVNALIHKVRELGVAIRVNSPVDRVLYQHGKTAGIRLRSGETITSQAVIIASGGKSVPHTGSEGDGYVWAQDAGHTITDLFPTEVPLTSKEAFIRDRSLQGLSLRDIQLTVWNGKGKKQVTHEGDMVFTHFGLSGPAALRCSQFVVKLLRKERSPSVLITIDLFPSQSQQELHHYTLKLAEAHPKKTVKNVLKEALPERLIPLLLQLSNIEEATTYDHISKTSWHELSGLLKDLPVRVSGTKSIEEAFVTGGGVHLKEIEPKSMHSRQMPGLFFCGEILDIHGYTGGYNITAAFSTGRCAGKHAGLYAMEEPAAT